LKKAALSVSRDCGGMLSETGGILTETHLHRITAYPVSDDLFF
jgi:hypothetical protein